MTSDDLTPAERYLIGLLREDMHKGFDGVHRRLDKMVTAEVMEMYKQGVDQRFQGQAEDIADLIAKRREDQKERVSDRRYRIGVALLALTAIIIPIAFKIIDLTSAAT